MSNISLLRFPSAVRIGENTIRTYLAADLKMLGGNNVMLITDPGVKKAGLVDLVESVLKDNSITYSVFSDVEPEPSIDTVNRCISFAEEQNSGVFIGLGGGSAMDVCKSTALCLVDGESIYNLFGQETVKRPGLKKILIPTTSGSGSESSPCIVLSDHKDNTKKAVWSRYALGDVVYLDPIMTLGLPQRVTGDSGVDALSHAIEAYSAKTSNSVTDSFALEAIRLVGLYLKVAYLNGKDEQTRLGMMKASFLAGLAFGGSGLGCVHALAYPFTTLFGYSHGQGQGMSMPHVLRFNVIGNEKLFARIAAEFGVNTDGLTAKDAAAAGIEAIEKLINEVGISTRLRDYTDITPDRFEEMADIAIHSNARLVNTNPRAMSVDDAIKIYQVAY